MKRKLLLITYLIFLITLFNGCNVLKKDDNNAQPNIIIIYLDDLGYGDVSCYGSRAIQTPNIDKLANGGMLFTNAYASSATCTPSRYALLTGVYPWRNKRAKILPGTAPLIIDTAQMTLPKYFQNKGYRTGLVGKWHLGLGRGVVDWNKLVSPGPNEVGFDYAYYLAATQDRVPTVYLENGIVQGLDPYDPIQVDYFKNFEGEPTGLENPELLSMKWHHGHNSSIVNGIPRIGYMKGGDKAKWSDVDMADHFLNIAKEFVTSSKEQAFFLYYALQQPHVPRTPHPRFVGSTKLGPRGDVIVEADWCIGELMKTLEKEELLDNTLLIFSSDNGPVLNDGYFDDSDVKNGDHKPAGNLRGGKYSLFEAGTKVPFITYWRGNIATGESDAMLCQMDIMQSLASLLGDSINGMDSQDLHEVLLGKKKEGRSSLILEATSRTAFRKGDWAMIPPYPGDSIASQVQIELGNSSVFQLYNLKEDPAQKVNLANKEKAILNEMILEFSRIRGTEYNKVEKLELK